jgi:branched-chain amino acid transport system substrate-binding protein
MKRLVFLLLIFPVLWADAPRAARSEVVLAAVVAQTGLARDYGWPALTGMELAVREINAAGGLLGEPLTLVPIDNQSTPIGAKWAGEQAVQLGAHGVVGATWSSLSQSLANVCQRNGVPMITPVSTRPRITRAGDFIFRVCFTDDFQGRILAGFALGELKAESAAVLVNRNEEYCQTLADFFIQYFVHWGGRLVWDNFYDGVSVDFSGVLEGIAGANPDLVFVPGYSRDSGLILRQARAMGIDAVFLGGDGWDGPMERYAGPALEGSFFSNHWHPGLQTPQNRAFLAAFRKVHGDRPISTFAPLGYDAVTVFADAVRRAGAADRDRIRAALAATREFPGVTGPIRFDTNGDPDGKTASILKRVEGRWQLVRTLGPNDVRGGQPGPTSGEGQTAP